MGVAILAALLVLGTSAACSKGDKAARTGRPRGSSSASPKPSTAPTVSPGASPTEAGAPGAIPAEVPGYKIQSAGEEAAPSLPIPGANVTARAVVPESDPATKIVLMAIDLPSGGPVAEQFAQSLGGAQRATVAGEEVSYSDGGANSLLLWQKADSTFVIVTGADLAALTRFMEAFIPAS